MGFFDDFKDMLSKIWDVAKPGIWEVFKFTLTLVMDFAAKIVAGYLTKEQARENAVMSIIEKFSNSPEFSENKARLMVELAVAYYKTMGEENSYHTITYKDEPDFMELYKSRPDLSKG